MDSVWITGCLGLLYYIVNNLASQTGLPTLHVLSFALLLFNTVSLVSFVITGARVKLREILWALLMIKKR